ncbi:peptidoglycan D,D-transpeptidase FtsI family protein [Paenibacillus paeoniae]|uniref:Penicillin-binding protein 2 n=1 Tax=Paenibacillus paeoniae TaxID=2292705 RepID=A0A371PNP1_9BACL|nr:penicillin-binding protein 2 [Paenibacillus paeoniae]REK77812.1 penicillin-binding protein 2 [Paenibacillus paeoniae]
MAKRAGIMGILISLILLFFLVRVAWLQLLPSHIPISSPAAGGRDSWKRMAVVQRQRSLVLDTGRGDFLDRNGLPITGETYMSVVFFPVRRDVRGSQEQLSKLAQQLGLSKEELDHRWNGLTSPDFWREGSGRNNPIRLREEQAAVIRSLQVEGVRVLPYRNRYLPQFDAKHWIGFTSQHPEWLMTAHEQDVAKGKRKLTEQVGGSGLERSLDGLLHGIGETSVSYFIDGRNAPLHGLDLRVVQPNNRYYPLKVVTTVDLSLQNEIEAYADAMGLKEGAIVVLDAHNADIVAMVSRPKMKPGHFDSGDGKEWRNYALTAVEPGSIYKLVTAAAALEHGVMKKNETFHCDGHYGRYGLSCWKEGGHGDLTFQEGIAQSCNIVFATIAERLEAEQLERTAEALGVMKRVGWHSSGAFGPFPQPLRLLQEEEDGRLFAGEHNGEDGGVRAQSGIGQRDVRMTPLQAANLMVTLIHGGRVMEPRVVSEVRYANGQEMVELSSRKLPHAGRSIRVDTAMALLRGMEAVVDHGTGQSIRNGAWKAAGKSGTAETIRGDVALNHQWFAGYGPVSKPRYAIAVLAANRPIGSSHQATKLFRGALDIAAKHSHEPRGRN